MSFLKHKEVPLGILVVCGVLEIIAYYFDLPDKLLSRAAGELQVWVVVLTSLALLFGGFSLIRRIYRTVSLRQTGWVYDIVGLIFLIVMLFTGLYFGTSSYQWGFLFDNFYTAVRSTMYSAGTFYVYSTWYRAMRVRNIDSLIMVAFAVLMILGVAPVFGLISPQFSAFKDYLSNIVQLGAMRGFQLSTNIGLSILALRIIIGMESSAIGLIPGAEE